MTVATTRGLLRLLRLLRPILRLRLLSWRQLTTAQSLNQCQQKPGLTACQRQQAWALARRQQYSSTLSSSGSSSGRRINLLSTPRQCCGTDRGRGQGQLA